MSGQSIPPIPLSELGLAALGYAERGWPVFPVKHGDKLPLISKEEGGNGYHDATTDPDVIRDWWIKFPDANIGLNLAAAGLVAVDADLYKPECQWANFIAGHDLPDTLMQRTARGGVHYIFRATPGVDYPGELCSKVDIKHKGYILLEPSRVEGKPYQFQTDEEPAPAPDWLPARRAANAAVRPAEGKASGAERDAILFALAERGNCLSREDWVRLCLALKYALGDQGRAAWLAFSGRYGGEQRPGEPERVWDTARPLGDLGVGTILHLLRAGPATGADGDENGFDLSHDTLARDLGQRSWDENARYVAGWVQWLFWENQRWTRDQSLRHMTRARGYLRRRAEELIAWAKRKTESLDPNEGATLREWAKREARTLRSANTVAAVTGLARSNAASVALPADFDADPWLLGTPGGTVDLRTGQLRPARREDMITRMTSIAPAPGRPSQWLAFLNDIFAGDQELIAFIQRAAGYALTGETREHKLLFFYGTGRNGKSVLLNILVHILNEYARRAHATSFLNTHGEKHPTDLAGLQGARLVVGSELPKGKSWDESAIKDLTGGDVITARFMRGDFFDYTPQFTLMIAGNTMPSFKGVDEALRARVVLVPFAVTIPAERRDQLLPEKLKAEARQILAWMIEGAIEWQRIGLAVPERVAAASKDYLDGEDTVGQFLDDETTAEPTSFARTSDLYERFTQWGSKQGLNGWTLMSFQKALVERGLPSKRTKHANGFSGVRLR